MEQMLASVRAFAVPLARWAQNVAVQTATATIEQARHAAAAEVADGPHPATEPATDPNEPGQPAPVIVGPDEPATVPAEVVQRWRSRRDAKVR
jgi:hypothetical protein